MNVEIGTLAAQILSRNIWLEFSVLVFCSVCTEYYIVEGIKENNSPNI
jgi:hypothetical protein